MNSRSESAGFPFLPFFTAVIAALILLQFRPEIPVHGKEEPFQIGSLGFYSADQPRNPVYAVPDGEETFREAGKLEFFFIGDSVPVLFMDTESGNMEAVHANKNHVENAVLFTYGTGGTPDVHTSVKVHGHGNTTWRRKKKSYTLTFPGPVSLFGLGAKKKYVLVTNGTDRTYLKNRVVYEAALRMGCTCTPETEFVNLYLNGQYNGLYTLVQKVSVGNSIPAIRNLGKVTRQMNQDYKAKPFGDLSEEDLFPPPGQEYLLLMKGTDYMRSPDLLTGGYLMSFTDRHQLIEEAKSGFTTRHVNVRIHSPKNASPEEVSYISGVVREADTVLYGGGTDYEQYFDRRSFAEQYLLQDFFMNYDACAASTYFYKDAEDLKLYAGPFWDCDNTSYKFYGDKAALRSRAVFLPGLKTEPDTWAELPWFSKLMEKPGFPEEVKALYLTDLHGIIRDILENDLPGWVGSVDQSAFADTIRWSTSYTRYHSAMEDYVEWLSLRSEFYGKYLENPASYYILTFHTDYDSRFDLLLAVEKGQMTGQSPAAKEREEYWADEAGRAFSEDRSVTGNREYYLAEVEFNKK